MLAQPFVEHTEASDLYDTTPGGTNLNYVEDINLSYGSWVAEWTSQLTELSDTVEVPVEAILISTIIKPATWLTLLQEHPSKPLVNFFIVGLSQSFRIGYCIDIHY